MTKVQQKLIEQIDQNGNVTVRLYDNGRGKQQYTAAESLREQGVVNFRGVGVPRDAEFIARSVYRRTA